MSGYNRQHNALFIHIPRTGGLSISSTGIFGKYIGHVTLDKLQRLYPANWNIIYKFAFVRNPWDRTVSVYHYLKQIEKSDTWYTHNLKYKNICTSITFDEFCRRIPEFKDEIHLLPQTHWILDKKGELGCNFIGRFENLQADFNKILKNVKISQRQLPKKNSSVHRNYREYYTPETKNIIGDYYGKTVEMFNYAF